jgi:hypothetical protein
VAAGALICFNSLKKSTPPSTSYSNIGRAGGRADGRADGRTD